LAQGNVGSRSIRAHFTNTHCVLIYFRMVRSICFAACAAVATGLTQPVQNVPQKGFPSVLILGSSVDRYATEIFCNKAERFYRLSCADLERRLNVGFYFHPGVGVSGDMQPPFYNNTRYGSNLENYLSSTKKLTKLSIQMFGHEFPDLVVVDSSLWDLATWSSQSGKNVTHERLVQWGNTDLPKLLDSVSETFYKSRVAFRSAPTVYGTKFQVWKNDYVNTDVAVFSVDDIENMNIELNRHIRYHHNKSQLYGKFDVIDYSKIMEDLINERGFRDPTLWLKDGYHPCVEASKRYFNKILQLMNMTTVEEKNLGQGVARYHERQPAFKDEFP